MNAASPASVPLTSPLYRASFAQAISRFFRKYSTFGGRASPSEFWWVALAVFLVMLVPSALIGFGLSTGISHALSTSPDGLTAQGVLEHPTAALQITLGLAIGGIIKLALIVPMLALIWRRLHDADLAGPWFFLSFLPLVGGFFLLALFLQPAKPGGRRFDEASA